MEPARFTPVLTPTVRNFIHNLIIYGHNYPPTQLYVHNMYIHVHVQGIQVYNANSEFKEGSRELGIEVLVICGVSLHLLQTGEVEEVGRAVSLMVKL